MIQSLLKIFYGKAQAAVSLPDFSGSSDIGSFVASIYSFALAVVGVVIFVRFIMAGFFYLTAAGNTSKTQRAKDMMTNAVVGTIILLAAYLILYVINPDLVRNTFNFGAKLE